MSSRAKYRVISVALLIVIVLISVILILDISSQHKHYQDLYFDTYITEYRLIYLDLEYKSRLYMILTMYIINVVAFVELLALRFISKNYVNIDTAIIALSCTTILLALVIVMQLFYLTISVQFFGFVSIGHYLDKIYPKTEKKKKLKEE